MDSFGSMQILTQTFSQQIYDRLRNAILSGDYKCGNVINAKVLASELGVSMMPVREALKHLEQTGLVEIRPRSMCTVKTPSEKTIISAMQMRELLEVYCVRQIYRDIDPARLQRLRNYNSNMEDALGKGEEGRKEFIYNDWLFHCELCSLADNEFISSFYPELYIRVNMGTMYRMSSKAIRFEVFVDDHSRLINALEQHFAEAVEIIERHLKNSQKNILGGDFFQGSENI